MRFVCPGCQTAGDIPKDSSGQPATQTICKNCGIKLSIDPNTGQVQKQPAGKDLQEEQTAERSRSKIAATSVISIRSQDKSPRDYLALSVFAIVLCALIATGVYFSANIDRGAWSQSTKLFSRLMDDVTRYGKSILGEFQKGQQSPNRQERQAKRHIRKGFGYYKENRLKKALGELNLAVEANPENPEAYFWRARIYIRLEQYDQAIADLNAVVKLNPRYAPAYDNLGWLFMRRNDYDKSLINLNKSIELKPDNGWAHYMRGRVFFNKGDVQKAFENAKAACELQYNEGCRDAKRYGAQLTRDG